MSGTPLLLVLSALCAGSVAQFSLSQEPSVTVAPGQTVKLSCTRSSGAVSSSYVSWYQQKPDTVPKLVMHSFSSRPSGVPSRFSGSYENTPNAAYLTITGVEAEDDAVYYCQSYVSGQSYTVTQADGEVRQKTLSMIFY
ncbi:hypothetical protein NDU88_006826 [Pleurodeles waltl]|uniref:Ig-like domain-containing protein n=1 Tax=Pleurodeles waltl TaxID=8319 RepID=A0AAV7LT18_PLEWA|nr:hypothetical protein NDU88_006826 [Pleurodeles waltl]